MMNEAATIALENALRVLGWLPAKNCTGWVDPKTGNVYSLETAMQVQNDRGSQLIKKKHTL